MFPENIFKPSEMILYIILHTWACASVTWSGIVIKTRTSFTAIPWCWTVTCSHALLWTTSTWFRTSAKVAPSTPVSIDWNSKCNFLPVLLRYSRKDTADIIRKNSNLILLFKNNFEYPSLEQSQSAFVNNLLKVNKRKTRTRCEICSKSTINALERRLGSFCCLYR